MRSRLLAALLITACYALATTTAWVTMRGIAITRGHDDNRAAFCTVLFAIAVTVPWARGVYASLAGRGCRAIVTPRACMFGVCSGSGALALSVWLGAPLTAPMGLGVLLLFGTGFSTAAR